MSKNIVIQEGGVGKQLTADKLKTNLVGGGTCLWVPEDERQLGTKYISENGTYKASDDGLYGYSEVTVSGVGAVTGKDEDGDDAQASVDPETGEIVTTKLVDHIAITNPPTKSEYQDGESLDFSGMVVHGYSSTGRDLGAISLNNLVMQPTVATYDGQGAEDTATSDIIDGAITISGSYFVSWKREISSGVYYTSTHSFTGQQATISYMRSGSAIVGIFASPTSRTLTEERYTYNDKGETTDHVVSHISAATAFTHDGKTVYYSSFVDGVSIYLLQEITPSPSGNVTDANMREAAWTAVYGTIGHAHSDMTVNVSYTGSDTGGKTLSTSFTVTVTPSA